MRPVTNRNSLSWSHLVENVTKYIQSPFLRCSSTLDDRGSCNRIEVNRPKTPAYQANQGLQKCFSWSHLGGRNSRVFGEKFCDKFITKFGEEFSESPNSSPNLVKNPVRSPNLVTNSVTYFVRNVVAHLYLHQI